jgi:hypothetical protein
METDGVDVEMMYATTSQEGCKRKKKTTRSPGDSDRAVVRPSPLAQPQHRYAGLRAALAGSAFHALIPPDAKLLAPQPASRINVAQPTQSCLRF